MKYLRLTTHLTMNKHQIQKMKKVMLRKKMTLFKINNKKVLHFKNNKKKKKKMKILSCNKKIKFSKKFSQKMRKNNNQCLNHSMMMKFKLMKINMKYRK